MERYSKYVLFSDTGSVKLSALREIPQSKFLGNIPGIYGPFTNKKPDDPVWLDGRIIEPFIPAKHQGDILPPELLLSIGKQLRDAAETSPRDNEGQVIILEPRKKTYRRAWDMARAWMFAPGSWHVERRSIHVAPSELHELADFLETCAGSQLFLQREEI